MKLTAHGIAIDLPHGWEGRIYRRAGGDPVLHAASYPLPASDGDFGSGAAAEMPSGGVLIVLKEYRPGQRLRAGHGLFESAAIPLPLAPGHFSPRALQVTRPGQAGFQHFFTAQRRPFCLYVVTRTDRRDASAAVAARPVEMSNRVLRTLQIGASPR